MYVNYVNDRKQLGYKVVKDMNCGIELVLISESTLLMIMNFPWLINWLKHEKAEQWYEQKHDAGYSESHEAAENHWSGTPWTNTNTNTNTEDKK